MKTTIDKALKKIQLGMNAPSSQSLIPGTSMMLDCESDCSHCHGSGYVRENVPIGHPKFGKIERCPNAKRRDLANAVASGELDPRTGMTVRDMQELSWNSIQKFNQAYGVGLKIKEAYMAGSGLFLLYGRYGQGKSLILRVTAVSALADGRSAAYANMSAVLDDIRLAYDTNDQAMSELVRRMKWWINLDVLCIDELDKTSETPWAKERLFRLLDERYARAVRAEALTVIAANYERLDELTGYLRSRMEDALFGDNLIYMAGPDARKRSERFHSRSHGDA
ncbi:MAG: AAA family ATPase [Anaerolineales bacterium]